MLSTFFGIGAQRAGTIWGHNCLSEHPDVFMPNDKEIQFFSQHFEQGIPW